MNETTNNYYNEEIKTEDDKEVCISELSTSALRGAVRLFELADEAAFDRVFN